MSTFDVSAYNGLPFIGSAHARFEAQLAAASLTRNQLFSKLAPLFFEADYACRYAVCLIHRHYSLNDGERMVTTGSSSKPSTETSEEIVGERWASTGEVMEFKSIENPAHHHPPPPTAFFAKFKSIVALSGVDILSICCAPGKLVDGYVFLESAGPGDREQVTTVVRRSSPELENGFEAAWIPMINEEDGSYTLSWACTCDDGCRAPKQPPPPFKTVNYRAPSSVEKFGIWD